METIFREIKIAYSVLSLQKKHESYTNIPLESEELRNKRRQALGSILSFIDSGVWCKYAKNKDEFLLNYRLSVKEYANKTGMSVSYTRLLYKRMSDKIREYLGNDTVYKVMTCKEKELNAIIYDLGVASNKSLIDDYLIEPLKPFMDGKPVHKEYSLKELENEIMFLRVYSKFYLDEQLKTLDKEKLQYLVNMIRGESNESFDKFSDIVKEIQSARKIRFMAKLNSCFKLGKLERTISSLWKSIDLAHAKVTNSAENVEINE